MGRGGQGGGMYESAEYSEADKEEGEGEVVIILRGGGGVWGVEIGTWLCFEHMYCRCRNYKYRIRFKTQNAKPTLIDYSDAVSQ